MNKLNKYGKRLILLNIFGFLLITIFLILHTHKENRFKNPHTEFSGVIYEDESFEITANELSAYNFNGLNIKDGDPIDPQLNVKQATQISAELEINELATVKKENLKIENFNVISKTQKISLKPNLNINGNTIRLGTKTVPGTFEIGDAILFEFNLVGENYKSKSIKTPVFEVSYSY